MKRVSETRTRPRDGAAAGNKGKRKKARTRRRRGRNPVGQGHPLSAIIEGQPRGGRYGPGVPLLNVGCERASERASCRTIFRTPFIPLATFVPSSLSSPEIDISTYLLSTARPIRAQAKQGILMRHAMRLQRNFDAYDTCRTSSRRVRLVITHGLMSPRSKICHCHVSDIT